MEQGENVDVVNLDFAKAYNKADHCTLIGKLKAMGVCGHLDQWLGSFLLERTQSVKIGDTTSEKEKIVSSLPQGSVLCPVMFIIFISDIQTNSNAMSYIYVDDSKVAMNVSNEEQVNNFQEELNIFYSWAKRNKMKFNEGKIVALR